MSKPKLLCLHGFLGSPNHFDFLNDDYNIFAPDLSEYVELSIEEIISKLEKQIEFGQYSILGYSFGSRLGLQILSLRREFKSFIGLAGHMGLKTKSEKIERLKFEDLMIKKLNDLSEENFISEWDNYDIFKFDTASVNPNFNNAESFFQNYGLSKQPYLQEVLLSQKSKIQMYYGDLDTKYKTYAIENLTDYSVKFIPKVGHRILNHHEFVKQICRENI